MRNYRSALMFAATVALAATSGRAQSLTDNSFDATFSPVNGNYSPSFASSQGGGTTVLGGTGKAAFFDSNNTGNVPTGWTLAGVSGTYGYWLNNIGTPDSTPRYLWLGSNETCLQNTITGLTSGASYRVTVSLAGWKGTITDAGAPQGGNGSPWVITQNHAALEFPSACNVRANGTTQLTASLVSVVAGSMTYAEFTPTVSTSAASLSWLRASVDITVPIGQNSVAFYLSPIVPGQENGAANSSNGLFADSVTVTAVPEPSTWAAGAALVLIGLFQWRSFQTRSRKV